MCGSEIAPRDFRVAWPLCPPRTCCSLLVAIPHQDKKNCHIGGNAFVSCNGFVPVTLCNLCLQRAMKSPSPSRRGRPKVYGWASPLQGILVLECVKFPPWGRVSAPTGVAPEALEECLYSSKGYKRCPAWLIDCGDCPASFSAGLGVPFSQPRRFSCWYSSPGFC